MKFTIEKEIFLKALARVQGIVEKRNTIPILSNVLIEAAEDRICLTATDLEVGMRAYHPAEVTTPGKVTVSAKKLFEIIKELPEKEIAFTSKDNAWIEIRCGKALFNIVGLSAEEFPYFPYPEEENFVELDSTLLKEMVDKTAFSISTDETKYNLNGIYFKIMQDEGTPLLNLVATDGHRLALIKRAISAATVPELEKGVIFPRKGIVELKKIADEGSDNLLLGFMDNNAVVKKGETVVVMRLVDGDFPDYGRVIPQSNEYVAVIQRDTLLHALRRVAILSSEKSRGVKLFIRPGLLEISSSNPDFGDAREDMEIDYQGPELSIGFNARYMIDILQVIDDEKVALAVKDNLSPGLIKPDGDDQYLTVVMPMRL